MAFLKHASGVLVHRNFTPESWGNFLGRNQDKLVTAGPRTASGSPNLVAQASEILGETFDPDRYLLTHATIVASVDTEDVPNVKLGGVTEQGRKITRKWSNYRVTPETEHWINNNHDSWDRPVLLKSYRTFVGAHNFCFATGTRVLMGDGSYRPIEQIREGDEVITHQGRSRKVTHVFERTVQGEVKALYVDRFKQPILCTGNHPFRTIDVSAPALNSYTGSKPDSHVRYYRDQVAKALRGERSTFDAHKVLTRLVSLLQIHGPLTERELVSHEMSLSGVRKVLRGEPTLFVRRPMTNEERDRRPVGSRASNVWTLSTAGKAVTKEFSARKSWVQAGDLEVGAYLLGPERRLGTQSCLDAAILLGYYLAEGCLIGTPDDPKGFVLSFGPQENVLAKHAQEIARRMFPGPSCGVHATQTTLRLNVYSRDAGNWVYRMGGHLAPTKRVSSDVFQWDRESLLHLLAAWMAGDGNVHKHTFRLRGTTTSEVLAQQMQRVAELVGVKSCVVQEKRRIGEVQSAVSLVVGGAPKRFDVIGRHHVWNVLVSKDSMHEVVVRSRRWGTSLQRVREVRAKRDDLAWWENCRVHTLSASQAVPYSGKVHNIEVEEDHSYVIEHGVSCHNCEHVQLEEQSKGRIIDAVARDIGPSVYTDILIATDRKHTSLIRDIESGKMGTLSMGCSVESTACTKCGNVAVDETQMCPCVKYEKGNSFFDERGVRRRVAELCGHHSLTPTGGVTFIEASWVAVPAFQGAVMRNILKPEVLSLETRRRAGRVLASPPPQWDGSKRQKAARIRTPSTWPRTDVGALTRLGQFEPPDEDDAGDEGKEEANPLESLEVEVEQFLLNKVRDRIRNKLKEDVAEEASSGELATSNEDNIVHQGSLRASLAEGTNALIRIARSDIELVDGLARLHADLDVNIRRDIYRTVLRVGSTTNRSLDEYLARCAKVLGRRITAGEAKTLVRLGRILSMWKRTQS